MPLLSTVAFCRVSAAAGNIVPVWGIKAQKNVMTFFVVQGSAVQCSAAGLTHFLVSLLCHFSGPLPQLNYINCQQIHTLWLMQSIPECLDKYQFLVEGKLQL